MNAIATRDLVQALELVPDVRTRGLPCTACVRSGSACHAKAIALADQHADLLRRVVAIGIACAKGQAGIDDLRAGLGQVQQLFGDAVTQTVCTFQARAVVRASEPQRAAARPDAANTATLIWFD